ncbi:hypothetical protein [Bradyrhizobium sp. HKCCYLR20261]|uniref:hypothetical protein n=1 Tax=Bradyrhizobium sp. HKCCYLR20261 TaxID=3420760 RepID=UPI003EBA7DE1
MRFEMALALVKRAEEHAKWIGDDHGDPYEEALRTGIVTTDMKLALKEILDHLRSALDYSAREICEQVTAVRAGVPIYFPIVGRSFKAADFRSRVGKLMPGVLNARPDLETILASFQYFSDQKNWWLPDLATLANETKHEQLSVNEVGTVDATFEYDDDGELQISMKKPGGTTFVAGGLMMADLPTGFVLDSRQLRIAATMKYLALPPIDQELLTFLKAAIPGTKNVISTLASAI